MASKILKILIFCLFLTQATFADNCSIFNLETIKKSLLKTKKDLSSVLFNRFFLEKEKNILNDDEKKIYQCLKNNALKIQEIKNITSNFTITEQLQDKYNQKILSLNNNNKQLENILLEIQNTLVFVDTQLNQNLVNDIQVKTQKTIKDIWIDYQANPDSQKISFIPFQKNVSPLFNFINNKLSFFALMVLTILFGLIGIYFYQKSGEVNRVIRGLASFSRNNNSDLFIRNIRLIFPLYLLTMPIYFFLIYATYNWLNEPLSLNLLNLIFRSLNIYLLALFIICFFLSDKFHKEKMIRLLIQSIVLITAINFIQMVYLQFLEKTNFSLLIYLLIWKPLTVGILLNYIGFKWAFIQRDLPFGHHGTIIYRTSWIGLVFVYSFIRIFMVYEGNLTFSTSQFILNVLVCIFYWKIIYMQFNPQYFYSKKQLLSFKAFESKIFGKEHRLTFEKYLIMIFVNIVLFLAFIFLSFQTFEVPLNYFYYLHNFIFSSIQIGKINFSIFNLLLAIFVFCFIVFTETIFSNYLISKYTKKNHLVVFKTQINFIHYLFKIIALIIALLAFGISASNLVILLGGLGLGVGLALQFILENFFCGLLIIIKRNFLVGDTIRIINISSGGIILEGKIVKILSLETKLIDNHHAEVILPNAALCKNGVIKIG
jgi:small-conductance mechanosensitive channel